jgi:3-hydroxymyristoyl/3-hydroxydecanoyl-(acyl carrier protein) dehydratase
MKHRLVDRILDWRPRTSIRGIKTVSLEEYCLKEAFGESARLPESLVLEGAVQLGQWLMVLSSDFACTGVLAGTERVCFDAPVRPGERMVLNVSVQDYDHDRLTFDAAGTISGRPCLAVTRCSLVPLPLVTCCDPADLRVLFGEIYQPRGQEA